MEFDWQKSPKRTHIEIIEGMFDPKGAKILDIGCGAGHIARALTKMGAEVIGVDPNQNQLKRARTAEAIRNETYLEGSAQDLPLYNQSMDIILFFNSFHHIPSYAFATAIEESHRVLRPGGKLFFAEPIADGPQFELGRLVNDETEIRALAYKNILAVPEKGFKEIMEFIYVTENRHKNFESYKTNSISINPARAAIFKKNNTEIRKKFNKFSENKHGFYTFKNPIRGNLFTRL